MKLIRNICLSLLAVLALGCGGAGGSSGGSINGFLSSNDWLIGNSFYADRYVFFATRTGEVTIEMDSGDFDTYLVVIDENNQVLEDDDSGPGTNARLTFQAFAGEEFEVRATSHFTFDTGAYRLRWSNGLEFDGELRGRAEGNDPLPGPAKLKEKANGTDLVTP